MFTKYGIPLLAALALIFATLSVARLRPAESRQAPYLPPPSAEFAGKVGAAGIVEASSENISVSLPVPGLVSAVYVKAGISTLLGNRYCSLVGQSDSRSVAWRDRPVPPGD